MDQQIQYCKSADGVQLAYSTIGKGTAIVRASHWLTHLEYDLKSPVLRHMVLGLAHRHSYVRYDARGTGLSQRDVAEISFERWVSDLECVVDALSLERFALLGVSQGAPISIQYAVRHPERVAHLIICGGWARGILHTGNLEKQMYPIKRLSVFLSLICLRPSKVPIAFIVTLRGVKNLFWPKIIGMNITLQHLSIHGRNYTPPSRAGNPMDHFDCANCSSRSQLLSI
jgi:pimeloyl-ACP methyl ester carboxylesterase